ncbi:MULTISPECIES: heavy metal translocating P-type ATPase [Streptomyces]|uniref:heavy metal translocating P-type ATPase n=1 Tax=Streptomyces TaxID=1883 RepID=UPI001E59E9C7|nr:MULTISPECIES: heavy metal translocating P-type ATPase [Streptomyces]UFQ19164.1 heavy metal translocating P-type ATPase [Streptomyces huasconensis]WCL88784.1 heavy metal translocating P-type ATPase [Streptomyces sp. JCM 35825]
MSSALVGDRPSPGSATAAPAPARRTRLTTLPEVRWAALATAAFLLGFPLDLAGAPAWTWGPLYALCYAAGGWEPGVAGLRALRERSLDVDLLMVVAALGAAAIGQFLDGGLLIVIFAVSGALEALATRRTADSVRGLLDLAPAMALRIDADGGEERVAAAALRIGDTVLVRPGERLPADGTVLDGSGEVDQATITGEPLPVAKEAGDEVFAGTLNGTGALRVRVGRDPADSVIARIVAMVEEASGTKAPTQLFIEKVEQRYSVGVVVATLALFTVPLAFGAALTETLLRAMTFMIVASPCAVVLATMPPLLSAIANAGRHGVLVKSAVVMERLGAVTKVALDKTGTLTEGAPRLTGIRTLPGSDLTEDEVLALAAAAEHPSEHPLARAVVGAARERGLALADAGDFAAAPGHGVRAVVAGRTVRVGSPDRLLAADEASRTSVMAVEAMTRAAADHDARTAVLVVVDGVPAALLRLADLPRTGAAEAVAGLRELTGSSPVLLTGDTADAAARLARETGIEDVRAGLLPQDKVAAVREWEKRGERVLVVGDGVNDAPALAAAHTGVAMGGTGSDLALETADAVVVRDELAAVPAVVALSRRARRVVVQNLVIASVCIGALVIWDLAGHLPLPLGVAGHEGSTVLVGLNGLRLLRGSAWRQGGAAAGRRG